MGGKNGTVTLPDYFRFGVRNNNEYQGGAENAQNIPAQEETETEGARLQKENGNC